MDTSNYSRMRKSDIISSIAGEFSKLFFSRDFTVKRTFDFITCYKNNSEAELWLPIADERYFGTFALFKLSVNFEHKEEFHIILNRISGFGREMDKAPTYYFRLQKQSKDLEGNVADFRRFQSFSSVLDEILKENPCKDLLLPMYSNLLPGSNEYFEKPWQIAVKEK